MKMNEVLSNPYKLKKPLPNKLYRSLNNKKLDAFGRNQETETDNE